MKKSILKSCVIFSSISITCIYIYLSNQVYHLGTNGAVVKLHENRIVNPDDDTLYYADSLELEQLKFRAMSSKTHINNQVYIFKSKKILKTDSLKVDQFQIVTDTIIKPLFSKWSYSDSFRAVSTKVAIFPHITLNNLTFKSIFSQLNLANKTKENKKANEIRRLDSLRNDPEFMRAMSSKTMITPNMIQFDVLTKDTLKANVKTVQKKTKTNNFMNYFLGIILSTGISFILLALIFIPLERVFPAHSKQKVFRAKWFLDLLFMLGQYFIWNALVLYTISVFENSLNHWLPDAFINTIRSQPFWLQCVEVIVLSDVLVYWAHRWQHNNNFLWRFHKVHHSSENLDWLASHREHPLDSLYTITIINLPAIILGFPLQVLSILFIFRGIWAIYIHSNININIGWLKYIIGAPNLHHWHHDQNIHKGNYANISPLMDLIFGTYYEKKEFPTNYGIQEESPKTYIGHILKPMLFFKKK